MKKIVFATLFFTHGSMMAQADPSLKEINEQVWKPFIRSFNAGDDEAFKAVHSKEIVRLSRDEKATRRCENVGNAPSSHFPF